MTVKYLQEQVNDLRHMILMMTGHDENEESRGGETEESRGGETEESRGGETEESGGGETEESGGGENEECRGGENEENRGGENKDSSGNVREKAGKKKKDGKRNNVQQKEDKRVSEEGLSGGRIVEDNKSRENEKSVDQKKNDDRRQSMQQKRGKWVSGEGLPGGKTVKIDDRRERGHSVRQERSFADVVSQRKARKAFMGDSIIRKVDKIVNRGDDITVCLPGAKIEDIAEKAGQVMGGGTGGAVLVHVGMNNAEKEGTSAIVGKYRRLIKTLKEARVGQIVLSGILPIMGGRGEECRNCRRMAINTQVQKVCMEEGVGFVDMWLNFSFSQRVINEWNKLPNDCVNASSVNMFKNRIDRYMIRALSLESETLVLDVEQMTPLLIKTMAAVMGHPVSNVPTSASRAFPRQRMKPQMNSCYRQ